MKIELLFLVLIFSFTSAFSQTNTFPPSGDVGIGTISPSTPLFVNGGLPMNFGWNRTATLKATYPVLIFNSNDTKWAGIGYDYSSNLNFWVNASSDNISGTGNPAFIISNDGNINMGIGNSNFKLAIGGETHFSRFLHLTSDNQEIQFYRGGGVYGYVWSSVRGLHWGKGSDYNSITIDNNGNTGIGTSDTKGYKLAVAGNMIAESIKVKIASTWPDFVFRKKYKIPSLHETEKHIKEKGHLPGIPSAEEVKTNGVDLGEMNAKLLQKIEELTLHLIEKDKEIKQLNKLSRKVEELELKLEKLINK